MKRMNATIAAMIEENLQGGQMFGNASTEHEECC